MADEEKVFSYIELTDDVPVQKLSIMEQIRLLMFRFLYDESKELQTETVLQHARLTLRSDCIKFLLKATEPIRQGRKKSVTINLSSKFDVVLNEALEHAKIAPYYKATILSRPQPEYDIPFEIIFKLEARY